MIKKQNTVIELEQDLCLL